MDNDRLGPLASFIGTCSFITFGIMGYINLKNPLNITTIVFGVIIGFLFGFLAKFFLYHLLSILNGDVKKEKGKESLKAAVNRSTIFMFPYAILALLAEFFLGWAAAAVFFSTAIMNTGVMASMEVGKLKGKSSIKNTIASSLIATAISYLWIFSGGYLRNFLILVDGAVTLGLSILGVKK
jgi:hypothetical protein